MDVECLQGRIGQLYQAERREQPAVLAAMIADLSPVSDRAPKGQQDYCFTCPAAEAGCDVQFRLRTVGKLMLRETTVNLPSCKSA